MRRACLAAATLAVAAAMPAAAAPPRTADLSFTVTLSFTPEALARLTRLREGMVIDASYYGDPLKRYAGRADEVGRIDLGNDRQVVEPARRRVLLSGAAIDRRRLGWLAGPVGVNVNVYSARRRGPDNILDCNAFDDTLAKARPTVAIHCGLLAPVRRR